MFIDTHTHVNFNSFRGDSSDVITRALDNNTWLINVGSQLSTSRRAVKIAGNYEQGVYAAVGIHPIHLIAANVDEEDMQFESRAEEFNYDAYKELAQNKKVVAIGEIGLDYFHMRDRVKIDVDEKKIEEIKNNQKETFIKQFKLAQELNLPVIIHSREAHEDLIEIIGKLKLHYPLAKGVIHCFDGDLEMAKRYFDLGLMVSFTGLVTFVKGYDWIKDIPEDKFMIETDSPYLTPPPYRGERNEPVYVKYIAQKIAEIRGVSVEKIEEITTRNAKEFFNI
jgi:TatD DNase family protein